MPNSSDGDEWVRICRIEAMRTSHGPTKALLLELAAEFENLARKAEVISPDDTELQAAVADRLSGLALIKAWKTNQKES